MRRNDQTVKEEEIDPERKKKSKICVNLRTENNFVKNEVLEKEKKNSANL